MGKITAASRLEQAKIILIKETSALKSIPQSGIYISSTEDKGMILICYSVRGLVGLSLKVRIGGTKE